MALKPVVSDLSEVPEAFRSLYVAKDGKHVLDLAGTPLGFVPQADHDALKNQHAEFRDNNRSLNGTVTSLQEKLKAFEGIDVAEVAKLKAEAEALRKKGVAGPDDIEARIAAALAPVTTELKTIKESEAAARKALANKDLENTLTQAGIKAGVDEKALPDYIARGLRTWSVEDGKVVAKGNDGSVLRKSGEPITPEQWAVDLASEAPHLYKPSGGSGAGAGGRGSGGGEANVRTIAAGAKLTEQDIADLGSGKAVREVAA